ncbi:carbohydrate ABC transporter permease [Oceanobacillus sojae]|uniref:carbohydrate ABC transporter permease n=1 Tax=Oceanobacillus sojae TaxID=582851 RepID=UPI0021A790DF|nr:carbohydrate ABC transporter permease [Oceanobacillus sojae]MCT1905247.1 carbohydrate ABC transporter permease [Oceanobacillus sojae]
MKRGKGLFLNIIGVLVVFVYFVPIYWMVITSFKNESEIFKSPPSFWPHDFQTSSFLNILNNGIGNNFLNSFSIATLSMIIVLLLAVPSAYGLARFSIKGKNSIIMFFLVTQMLPSTIILTPLFIMFNKFGLLNTYAAPIITTATLGIPFSILILRTFFLNAPKELEEAAKIDGCNRFTAFIRIVIPITRPGIIVSAAISFLFAWGDLIFSITFNKDQSLWPLTTQVYQAIGQYGIEWNSIMAIATLTVLPVVIIFVMLQKHLIKGLVSGAIK